MNTCSCGCGTTIAENRRYSHGHNANRTLPPDQRKDRASHVYIKIFLRANGLGPWLCEYCNKLIYKRGQHADEGVVHHRDHNKFNDDVQNLGIMHHRCHRQHHMIGVPVPEERKRKIGAKLKGRQSPTLGMKFPDDVNARKGRSGKRPELSAKSTCVDCGNAYNVAWMTRHKNDGKCVK